MSTAEKKSSSNWIVTTIVGIALAIGGYWFSMNVHLAFQEALVKQHIPLDLGKTISMLGMFILLFPVLKMFYFKPLGDAITERTTDLERTFSEAEDLRAEMTKMRSEYEARLAATEAQAREQIQAQIKEAQILRQTLMAEAAEKADDMVRRAQVEIEGEKQKALVDLRLNVVNLTLAATEKVIDANVDTERNRKLVEEFLDTMEVAR